MTPGSEEAENIVNVIERYIDGSMDEETLEQHVRRNCQKTSSDMRVQWQRIFYVGCVCVVFGFILARVYHDSGRLVLSILGGLAMISGCWLGWLSGPSHGEAKVAQMMQLARDSRAKRLAYMQAKSPTTPAPQAVDSTATGPIPPSTTMSDADIIRRWYDGEIAAYREACEGLDTPSDYYIRTLTIFRDHALGQTSNLTARLRLHAGYAKRTNPIFLILVVPVLMSLVTAVIETISHNYGNAAMLLLVVIFVSFVIYSKYSMSTKETFAMLRRKNEPASDYVIRWQQYVDSMRNKS